MPKSPSLSAEKARTVRRIDPIGHMLSRSRSRAKRRGIDFTLSRNDITIPEFCPVLGIKLQVGQENWANSPSLDRLDPALGYIPENVRVISRRANLIKNNASLDELKLLLRWL